jgi:hypothetical protein
LATREVLLPFYWRGRRQPGRRAGSQRQAGDERFLLDDGIVRFEADGRAVAAKSAFGDFQSQYSQEGRVLRAEMRIAGAEGVFPKERLADLETWLKALANGTVKSLVARPPAAP